MYIHIRKGFPSLRTLLPLSTWADLSTWTRDLSFFFIYLSVLVSFQPRAFWNTHSFPSFIAYSLLVELTTLTWSPPSASHATIVKRRSKINRKRGRVYEPTHGHSLDESMYNNTKSNPRDLLTG